MNRTAKIRIRTDSQLSAFAALSGRSTPTTTHVLRRCLECGFLILVLAEALSPAQAQTLQSTNDQTTIRGTVINSITRLPIPRALVYSADQQYAVMTDGDGHFEFTVPPGTELWLNARKPGFLGDRNAVRGGVALSVVNGMAIGSGATSIQASSGSEITIPLPPESIIKGRVSLGAGETLPHMPVQLLARQVRDGIARWSLAGFTQTKSDGSFRFAELEAGSYKLMTHEFMDRDPVLNIPGSQKLGYPPVYFPAAADFSAAAIIDVIAGQTVEANLSASAQPYYPVTIPVPAEINGSLDIRVMLQGERGPRAYTLGYSGATHRIEGLLPNGNFTVEASAYGPDSSSGVVNLKVAGAPVETSPLTLTRNSSVTLHVKEEFTQTTTDNARPPTPRDILFPRLESADDFPFAGSGMMHSQTHPDDSSIVMENIKPGRYWFRAATSRGYIASATMGGLDLLHQPFEVSAGSTIPVEITLRDDTATLEGTVANPSQSANAAGAATSAWLYLIPGNDGPGQFQSLNVSLGGKFSTAGIAPGTYRLLAFATAKEIPYRDPEAMRAYESKGQVIQLAAGQSTSVQLQVIPDE